MSAKRDLLLPVLTGVIAIVLERWLYHRSTTLRELTGPRPGA